MTSKWQFSSNGWRNASNPWFRLGTFEVTTTVLVTAIGVATMFLHAANPTAFNAFYFSSTKVRHGDIWRVVSWPLYNPPSFQSALNLLFFFIFGREIEGLVGRNRFLGLLATVVILPSVVMVIISALSDYRLGATGVGLRLVGFAVFAASVAERPQSRTFFGIQLWVLGAVFLGIDILQLLSIREFGQILFELLIIATALFIVRGWGFADNVDFIPRIPIPGRTVSTSTKTKRPKRVWGAKGTATVTTGPWTNAESSRWADQAHLDSLLDKVGEVGLAGLTPAERQQLDDLSRRMRGNT